MAEEYTALQAAGEEMWFYLRLPGGAGHEPQHGSAACREPYRAVDGRSLPAVRIPALGFQLLHRGRYLAQRLLPHKGALLPAGDAHIVYPGKDGRPWRSMRFEAQRAGAEDYELLMQAVDAAPARPTH